MEIELTATSVINEDGFEEARFTNDAISNLLLRDKGVSKFFERGSRYKVAFTKIEELEEETKDNGEHNNGEQDVANQPANENAINEGEDDDTAHQDS